MKESDCTSPEKTNHIAIDDVSSLSKGTSVNELQSGFLAVLTQQGLLKLTGEDAVHFIHGQLSNDVEHMGMSQASLAGYCTPQGRLLASPFVWRGQKEVYLALPREILPALQKRLQMYVLRAKVTLSDVSEEHVLLGLGGQQAEKSLKRWFTGLPIEVYEKKESEFGTLIRMADAFGFSRYLWAVNLDSVHTVWDILASELSVVHENSWNLCNIASSVPEITLATQDQFVPQMVNLEAVGGLSFQKGCYPGQEVVARSQYRGKIKRRMFPGHMEIPEAGSSELVVAGSSVYSDSSPDEDCGVVLNVVRRDAQRVDLLVVMHVDFLSPGQLHIGSAKGPVVHLGALPYALSDDDSQASV